MARRSGGAQPVRKSKGGGSAGLALWLGLAAVVLLFDQFTKVLIVGNLALGDSHTVTSFFNVVRVHNTGAAFNFLADAAGWQRWFFVGLGTLATAVITWLLRSHPGQTLFCFSVSMILGGAVGNVVDRLWHGHVIDFLQFHWAFLEPLFRGGYFPSFNIADCGITLGAIGLVLDELRRVRRS